MYTLIYRKNADCPIVASKQIIAFNSFAKIKMFDWLPPAISSHPKKPVQILFLKFSCFNKLTNFLTLDLSPKSQKYSKVRWRQSISWRPKWESNKICFLLLIRCQIYTIIYINNLIMITLVVTYQLNYIVHVGPSRGYGKCITSATAFTTIAFRLILYLACLDLCIF